jgi:hypothetical protein
MSGGENRFPLLLAGLVVGGRKRHALVARWQSAFTHVASELDVLAAGRREPLGQPMNVRVDVSHQIGLLSTHVVAHGPSSDGQQTLVNLFANLALPT